MTWRLIFEFGRYDGFGDDTRQQGKCGRAGLRAQGGKTSLAGCTIISLDQDNYLSREILLDPGQLHSISPLPQAMSNDQQNPILPAGEDEDLPRGRVCPPRAAREADAIHARILRGATDLIEGSTRSENDLLRLNSK